MSITIVVIGISFYFLKKNHYKNKIKKERIEHTAQIKQTQQMPPIKFSSKLKSHKASYDYENLINLMDACRKLKREFYSNFNEFTNKKSNIKTLKKTLKNLKIERSIFKRYLKDINLYKQRREPNRFKTSLRYYFRVLDEEIGDFKKMLSRFNLSKLHIESDVSYT